MERVLKKLRGFAITTIKRSRKSIQNRRQRKKRGREEVLGTTIIEETIPNPDFKVQVGNDIVKENHDLRVHVGDDIVFEILTWLPYKSIMRFKCISKAWNTLAQHDPNFIKLHIVRSHAYFLSHPPLL